MACSEKSNRERILRKTRLSSRGTKTPRKAGKDRDFASRALPKKHANNDPRQKKWDIEESSMQNAVNFIMENIGKSPKSLNFEGKNVDELLALTEHLLSINLGGWEEEPHYYVNKSGRTASKSFFNLKEGHLYERKSGKPAYGNADWLYEMKDHLHELAMTTTSPIFEQGIDGLLGPEWGEGQAFDMAMKQADLEGLADKRFEQEERRELTDERDLEYVDEVEQNDPNADEIEPLEVEEDEEMSDERWEEGLYESVSNLLPFEDKLQFTLLVEKDSNLPKKVEEYATSIGEKHPDWPKEKKIAIAYSTYNKEKK
jgi:hypothetical protein